MTKLLLFSASLYRDTQYLSHAKSFIYDFLEENKCHNDEILFIPYAGVRRSNEEYEQKVSNGLNKKVISIHRFNDKIKAIEDAKAIIVGGGNSFMLLALVYKFNLLEALRAKVHSGTCYIGWSAGSNIAGKSIKTCNDMPIIMPKSLESIGAFKHHINPHFISGKFPNHNGESREERLEEFLIINPHEIVYALPEGSALKIYNDECEVLGFHNVLKISKNMHIEELALHTKYRL